MAFDPIGQGLAKPLEQPSEEIAFDPIGKGLAKPFVAAIAPKQPPAGPPVAMFPPEETFAPSPVLDFKALKPLKTLDPQSEEFAAIASQNEIAFNVFTTNRQKIVEQAGEEAAQLWEDLTFETNRPPQDFNSFKEQQLIDEPLSTDVANFAKGIIREAPDVIRSLTNATKSVIESTLSGIPPVGLPPTPELETEVLSDAFITDAKSLVAGGERGAFGLANLGQNVAGATMDAILMFEGEAKREYIRNLSNQKFAIDVQESKIFDSKDLDPDVVLLGEITADPGFVVFGFGGKLGSALFKPLGKIPKITQEISRGIIKTGTGNIISTLESPVLGGGKKILNGAKFIGRKGKEFAEEKLPRTAARTERFVERTSELVPAGIVKDVAQDLQDLAKDNFGPKQFVEQIAAPDQQKRFLQRLAANGNGLAAMAESFGGTQVGDVLFNAVVNSTASGAFSTGISLAQGANADDAARAFTESFFGVLPTAGFGPRGAGATIETTPGQISAREAGSIDLARGRLQTPEGEARNKIAVLKDIYQNDNFANMPAEYQQVLGAAAELNLLPKNVLFLKGQDFNQAANSINKATKQNETLLNVKYDNGALYFPKDDVLLLNADSKLTGRAAMSLVGEEISHSAVKRMIQNDPGFISRQMTVFEDSKGVEMPISERIKTDGVQKTIKVKKELSDFVDSYNKNAEVSGAPLIKDFTRAVDEFFAGQGANLFSQGTEKLFNSVPNSVKFSVNNARKRALNFLGVDVAARDKAASLRKIKDTGLRRYAEGQLKQFLLERNQLDFTLNDIYNKRGNIKVPETEGAIEFSKNILERNPRAVGEVISPSFEYSASSARTIKIGMKFKEEIGKIIDKTSNTNPNFMARVKTRRGEKLIGKEMSEQVAEFYLRSYSPRIRDEVATTLSKIQSMINNKMPGEVLFRSRTGKDSNLRYRTFVPMGFEISGPSGNLKIQLRELDAFDSNINLVIDRGLVQGKTKQQLKKEMMAEFEANRDTGTELSDVAKIVLRDELKGAPKLNNQRAVEFFRENKGKVKNTFSTFDFEGMLGLIDLPDSNSPFAIAWDQPGTQFSVMLANPTPLSPKGKAKLDIARDSARQLVDQEPLAPLPNTP